MASVAELHRYIGRRGLASLSSASGIRFEVEVKDVRERFSKIDLLVTPTAGDGEAWLHENSVELAPSEGQGGAS